MRTIAELNLLLHTTAELPTGLKLTTEEFDEGWSFVRRVDARRLEKRIHTRGWNFIRFAAGSLRSGIGDTSQEAIASALKLALRRVSNHSNAVEVEHIELTRYPWFFLARVRSPRILRICRLKSISRLWVALCRCLKNCWLDRKYPNPEPPEAPLPKKRCRGQPTLRRPHPPFLSGPSLQFLH